MFKRFCFLLGGLAVLTAAQAAEPLTPQWEYLTSTDFQKAIAQAGGTCLLPMGSVDKFGPAGPLGSDLLLVRAISLEAARSEYAVVFPPYYAGGTEAYKGFAGTVTYSTQLQYDLLDETTHEMARNGCLKILIVNGNSGSNALISQYMNHLTATPHDYAVYSIYGSALSPNAVDGTVVAAAQPSKPGVDGHGGEDRISAMLVYYPALVHVDRAHDEPVTAGPTHLPEQQSAVASTAAVGRPGSLARANPHIQQVEGIETTPPTGYSGDASGATVARGRALVSNGVHVLIAAIREVKADSNTIAHQKQLNERMENPVAPR